MTVKTAKGFDRYLKDNSIVLPLSYRVVIFLLVSVAINFFSLRFIEPQNGVGAIKSVLLSTFFLYGTYYWNKWDCALFMQIFPGIENTGKRILFAYMSHILITTFCAFLFLVSLDLLNVNPDVRFIYHPRLFYFFLFAWSGIIITALIFESLGFFALWRRASMEKEELKRLDIQTQYDMLKTQINPHFLFNSFNSLYSLIDEDIEKADLFIQEMSKVYRYLLQTNDESLTKLYKEIDFIKAYFFLLSTRFGESLKIDLRISEELNDCWIPPLTLQLLIENAVKHNVVSSDKPLLISVFQNDQNELVVQNNLQPKLKNVASNKVGLENISKKFRLLKLPEIVINRSSSIFEVKLPLILKREMLYTPAEA
jgi:hypothetical protein